MNIIETERLILRTWEDKDAEEYYHINQDSKVIEFVLGSLTMQQIKNFMNAMNEQFEKLKFTVFAAEEKYTGKLIGFIGLNQPKWESHFTPCVEIGWRLGSQYWNQGYATEGAKAVLEYGFNRCGLTEIVSFSVPENIRSIHVMEKIGMRRDMSGDFVHPDLSSEHRLSKHILYRLKKPLANENIL